MEEAELSIVKRSMLSKWFIIPYSILVIMWAGGPYNLQEYWKFTLEESGFIESTENYTLLAVMSGYYFGALTGIIIHRSDSKHAYGIAAMMALIGYVGLGISVKLVEIEVLSIFLSVMFFFIISFSASLAMMAAVNTPIECFDRFASFLIIGLLIGYIKISPVFERIIQKSWFRNVAGTIQDTDNRKIISEDMRLLYYFTVGIIISIIYLIGGCFETNYGSFSENCSLLIRSIERRGLYVFTFVEVVLIFAIYFMSAENPSLNNNYNLYIVLTVLASNFLVYLIAYWITIYKVRGYNAQMKSYVPEKGMDLSFLVIIKDIKYIGLFIPSILAIGTCSATYHFLYKLSIDPKNKMRHLEPLFDDYWLIDALARIFCAVNAYLFTKIFPKFLFAIFGILIIWLGFVLLITYEWLHYISLMHFGLIGIGAGCGIWWVIAPIIILDDIGFYSFDIVWGITLSFNFLGLFFYTVIFNLVWANISHSLLAIYWISLVSWWIALPMWIYSYREESKEKPLKIYNY